MPSLNVLADTGSGVGLGHVSRCMVIAKLFKKCGVDVCFFVKCPSSAEGMLKSAGFDVKYNSAIREVVGADYLLIDSYQKKSDFFEYVSSTDAFVMVIDDFGNRRIVCDAYFNHNIFAPDLDLSKIKSPLNYLGPNYLLVSGNFFHLGSQREKNANFPKKILISFGGSDNGQYCLPVVSAIKNKGLDLPITIVANGLDAHKVPRNTELIKQLSQADLTEAFANHGLVIFGAGQSSLEAIAARQPAIPVVIAPNQELNALALQSMGVKVAVAFNPVDIAEICCGLFSCDLWPKVRSLPRFENKLQQAVTTIMSKCEL